MATLFSAGVGIAHPLNLSFFLFFFLLLGDSLLVSVELCDPLNAAPRLGPAAPRGRRMGLGPSRAVMFLLINPGNQLVLLTMALSHSTTASRAFEVT